MDALVRQVKDLSDHFLALSWRLDLQEQTLTQKLREVRPRCCLGVLAPLWLPKGRDLISERVLRPPSDCL